jgi:hypothetical protein
MTFDPGAFLSGVLDENQNQPLDHAKLAKPAKDATAPQGAIEGQGAGLGPLAGFGPASLPAALDWRRARDAGDLTELACMECGGAFHLKDGRPVWRGRDREPSPELRQAIADRTPEIIALLLSRAERRRAESDWSAADWQAHFDECASILEYDHRCNRGEAERRALVECLEHWQRRCRPIGGGAPDMCWQCGRAGDHDSLTSVLGKGGPVWLHPHCMGAFHVASERAAEIALREMLPSAPWPAKRGGA